MALQKIERFETMLLLEGDGMSRRGIRVRMLEPKEKRAADAEGFASLKQDPDLNQAVISQLRVTAGVKKMLIGVTERCGFKDMDALRAPDVAWQKLSEGILENHAEFFLENPELFTTRDREFIDGVYHRLHTVMEKEFDAVMGKSLKVSSAATSPSTETASTGTATSPSGS